MACIISGDHLNNTTVLFDIDIVFSPTQIYPLLLATTDSCSGEVPMACS